MALKGKAPGGSKASRYVRTGYVSSAVSVCHYTLPPHAASRMKASIVDILAELVSIDPALAATWSHVVEALWPGWREL